MTLTNGQNYLEWFGQGIENMNEKEKEKIKIEDIAFSGVRNYRVHCRIQ